MPRQRVRSSGGEQRGLFCRTCFVPLVSTVEQAQGECDRCYDLFAEPPVPAISTDPPDDLDIAWLQVTRPPGGYPEPTARAGKWLVLVGFGGFERAWAAIRTATEAGQLGPSARVAPAGAYRTPKTSGGPQLVIEVTTYDATDAADVWRVRQAIRTLGITAALTYRPDQAPAREPPPPHTAPRRRTLFD